MVAVDVNKTGGSPIARMRVVFVALLAALALAFGTAAPAAFAEGAAAGTVTVSVVGVDNVDDPQPKGIAWVAPTTGEFDGGTTAWDAFKAALDEAGCTYDAQDSEYGIFVQSITAPDGTMLENTDSEPYSYWSFLVNGEMASVGVSGYELQDGDAIELVYYANGEAPVVEAEPQVDDGATIIVQESEPMNMGLVVGGIAVVVVAGVVAAYVVKSRKKDAE